jgi:hypothetical protein
VSLYSGWSGGCVTVFGDPDLAAGGFGHDRFGGRCRRFAQFWGCARPVSVVAKCLGDRLREATLPLVDLERPHPDLATGGFGYTIVGVMRVLGRYCMCTRTFAITITECVQRTGDFFTTLNCTLLSRARIRARFIANIEQQSFRSERIYWCDCHVIIAELQCLFSRARLLSRFIRLV